MSSLHRGSLGVPAAVPSSFPHARQPLCLSPVVLALGSSLPLTHSPFCESSPFCAFFPQLLFQHTLAEGEEINSLSLQLGYLLSSSNSMKYLGKELNETLESERGSASLELVVPAHGAVLCVPLTWTPQLSAQHLGDPAAWLT